MRQGSKHVSGFTLVELLVVIAIIGTLVGMLLPAVQSAREASRRSQCTINLSQVRTALQLYEENNERLPGYVNGLGIDGSRLANASWVVMVLPYLEQNVLWEEWNSPKEIGGSVKPIEVMMCPSNPPFSTSVASLSYVVNAGYVGNEPEDICEHRVERRGNGMFFDRTRFGGDQRDYSDACLNPASDPVINMSIAYVQTGEGSTASMMLTETLRTAPWADSGSSIVDRKWHYGFCWEQPDEVLLGMSEDDERQYFRINGNREPSEYSNVSEKQRTDAFPSSHHPGGVNAAFAGGNVRSISDSIDLLVYAQLMTSNRTKSELYKLGNNDERIPEKDLAQPNDSQY